VVAHAGSTFTFPQQPIFYGFTGEYLTASCTTFGKLGSFSGAAWSCSQSAEHLQERQWIHTHSTNHVGKRS
jgi:hypothetical protein